MCSGLFCRHEDTREDAENQDTTIIMRLTHFSIREYLISESILQGPAREYSMQEPNAQALIANECIAYLLQFDRMESLTIEDLEDFPLADYAARYWAQHAQVAEDDSRTEPLLSTELFLSKGHAFLNTVRLYDPDNPSDGSRMERTLDTIMTPLYYASMAGLVKSVEILLRSEHDFKAWDLDAALQAASTSGHMSVVEVLVANGDDIQKTQYGAALLAALKGGHIQVVRFLLDHGASVNSQGPEGSTALMMAASEGYDSIVRLLIASGADINAQGRNGRNALHLASSGGRDEVVRILLDHGADVNAQRKLPGSSKIYINALGEASSRGFDRIVKLLLEHGADPDAHGGGSSRALDEASAHGHQDVVQMLLDYGATAGSGEGYTGF